MYTDDFDGYVMRANTGVSGTERTFQSVLTKIYGGTPYVGSSFFSSFDNIKSTVWQCPSGTKCWGEANSGWSEHLGSYGLNESVTGNNASAYKINRFTEPTGCAVTLDGWVENPSGSHNPVLTTSYFFTHPKSTSSLDNASISFSHSDKSNIVFVDGHAEAIGHESSGRMFPLISRIGTGRGQWYK